MSETSTTLFIADDHPIFRQGLRCILSEIPRVEVIGETDNGKTALEQCLALKPDILLLDLEILEMDGLSVLEKLRKHDKSIRVIILTSYDDQIYLDRTMDLGGNGYVLKDEAPNSLAEALKTVIRNETYISPSLGRGHRASPAKLDHELLKLLTPTERKILSFLGDFKTSKEIAQDLDISYRTVQNHRNNICRKLELQGMHQLMQFARNLQSQSK